MVAIIEITIDHLIEIMARMTFLKEESDRKTLWSAPKKSTDLQKHIDVVETLFKQYDRHHLLDSSNETMNERITAMKGRINAYLETICHIKTERTNCELSDQYEQHVRHYKNIQKIGRFAVQCGNAAIGHELITGNIENLMQRERKTAEDLDAAVTLELSKDWNASSADPTVLDRDNELVVARASSNEVKTIVEVLFNATTGLIALDASKPIQEKLAKITEANELIQRALTGTKSTSVELIHRQTTLRMQMLKYEVHQTIRGTGHAIPNGIGALMNDITTEAFKLSELTTIDEIDAKSANIASIVALIQVTLIKQKYSGTQIPAMLNEIDTIAAHYVDRWFVENQALISQLNEVKGATPAAPEAVVADAEAMTDIDLRQRIDTETFLDARIADDLKKFASEANQGKALSSTDMHITKETKDLLDQLSTTFGHPFFKFTHRANGLFEIEVKKNTALTYHNPIEIAKIIYGLMQKSEVKQIKYPAAMNVADAPLLSLIADINSNFNVLQHELDQLKPNKTLKRISEKVFGSPTAKKVGQATQKLVSKTSDRHAQRLAELTALAAVVTDARKDYNATKNSHNFNRIKDGVEHIKRTMRRIKRETHSPAELKEYESLINPALEYSLRKHLFRTVRHAIWDGGKRTRRLRKKK